jgi:Mg2+ and Co2+ transporter CorA
MELSGEKSRSELRDIWSSGPSNGFGGHQQPKALKSQTTDLTMQFEAKLTLDGLMTIVAGIIAFVAVIIQIRSSSRQVRDQIQAQREAEQEDKERQKRAVAKALLFEIDDFYLNHLRGVDDHYRNFDGAMEKLPGVTGMDIRPFAVYDGSTPSLGTLSDEVVKSVVVLYDTARFHLLTVRDYKEMLREYQYGSHSPEAGQEARQLFFYVRASIPRLTRLSYETCMKLACLSNVPFRKDIVNVAGEDTGRLARDEDTEAGRHRDHGSPIHN